MTHSDHYVQTLIDRIEQLEADLERTQFNYSVLSALHREAEAELALFVPVGSPFETFTAGDGGRSMRARDDLYERKEPN